MNNSTMNPGPRDWKISVEIVPKTAIHSGISHARRLARELSVRLSFLTLMAPEVLHRSLGVLKTNNRALYPAQVLEHQVLQIHFV